MCARIRPHVQLPDVDLGDPSFYPTLQAYAGAPIVDGNRATILLNGDEIFPAVLKEIRSARESIAYVQYFYSDGPVARAVARRTSGRVSKAATTLPPTHPEPCRSKRSMAQS